MNKEKCTCGFHIEEEMREKAAEMLDSLCKGDNNERIYWEIIHASLENLARFYEKKGMKPWKH